MRWDELFDDLESQLERELTAEELDLDAEEERLRLGRLGVRDRLGAVLDHPLTVWFADGERLRLRPLTLGRDWFSADIVDDVIRPRQVIVPLHAVAGITPPREAIPASLRGDPGREPALTARLGLPFVLRDLCRRRRAVGVELGASTVHGTIDRVGRDHLDLAVHEPGVPRRDAAVAEVRIVPFDAVRLVRL
jgi:hypothetical protein